MAEELRTGLSDHLIEIVDEMGVKRTLGNIPAPLRFNWNPYGEAGSNTPPLIPRDEWDDRIKELNQQHLDHWALPPIHDQDGIGQCNCDATTALVEFLRAVQGLPYVALSSGDLYGRINGGYDRGSLLEDAMEEMLRNGVGSVASYGSNLWQRGKNCSAEERSRFKALEVWICPTFNHVMSAGLVGIPGVTGIMWGSNYTPDEEGWLPESPSGGGGHAIMRFPGAYVRQGRSGKVYGLPHVNSWSPKWGYKGKMIIPEGCYRGPVGGWWACRVVTAEDGNMPLPKEVLT